MAARKKGETKGSSSRTYGRTLVIAEKPSVAQNIAQVLFGESQKRADVVENDAYVVTSAIGHLVEHCMPKDLAPHLCRWTLDNLPIVPERFLLKAVEKTKERFDLLCKLLNSSDIKEVINACDSGREGELIFSYIYELSGSNKPFRRLWLVSMTPNSIEEAFRDLRSAEEMVPLQEAARCRSEADWLIGINGTRAITACRIMGAAVASVGRVQTPTLALVVARDRTIRNFQPVPYWRILGKFSLRSGTYEGAYHSQAKGHGRIWEEAEAKRVLDVVAGESWGVVTEKRMRSHQAPPRLYDLRALQSEANSRYGLSAAETLKILQGLYEKHKVITYPRTDSRALPEDYQPVCVETIRSLERSYGALAVTILTTHGVQAKNQKIFNNKAVKDHFAIIPTSQEPVDLTSMEEKIYKMVVLRFLAAFYPPAEYDVIARTTTVAGHTFLSEARELAVSGWLVVYGRDQETEKGLLPSTGAEDGDPPRAAVANVHLSIEQTQPPAPYSDATLLSAMATAGRLVADEELAEAMREKGLGTPATRAQIIENLISIRYLQRNKQENCLLSTAKAERLIDCLEAVGVETLKNPAMTGEWEWKLRRIEQRDFSRPDFMAEIVDLTRTMVDRIRNHDEAVDKNYNQSEIISPLDGKPLLESQRDYLTADRKVRIARSFCGHNLVPEEVVALLREGRIGPFDDFRSRMGKPFQASIVLRDGVAKFEFKDHSAEWREGVRQALVGSTAAAICPCPICEGKVYWTEQDIFCERVVDGRCNLHLSRCMLGHEFSREEVLTLLTTRKSPLIENFVSNRTERAFRAYLLLDRAGKITFKFPPRVSTAKKKRKGSDQDNDTASPASHEAQGPDL